jgi:hypothetical protein
VGWSCLFWRVQIPGHLLCAPIIIICISLSVGVCGIQIVPAWIFQTGITINIIAAPGILGQFLEQLIPACRSGIILGLCHQCLQSLLSGWEKPVHTLVQMQLLLDRLDVRLNRHMPSKVDDLIHSVDSADDQIGWKEQNE